MWDHSDHKKQVGVCVDKDIVKTATFLLETLQLVKGEFARHEIGLMEVSNKVKCFNSEELISCFGHVAQIIVSSKTSCQIEKSMLDKMK